MKKENKQDWEKEFEENFKRELPLFECTDIYGKHIRPTTAYLKLRKFIKKQLTKAREEGRREQVSETKSKFVEIAQKGFGDDDNLKGLMLYERFMEYLKSLKDKK